MLYYTIRADGLVSRAEAASYLGRFLHVRVRDERSARDGPVSPATGDMAVLQDPVQKDRVLGGLLRSGT